MTLLDAKQYDPERDRRRNKRIVLSVLVILVLLLLGWWFRYWPEEHLVGKFFDTLQKQDYKGAYGIWMHDPEWQQHPERHPKYPFSDFYRDWGPGGEWGVIKSAKVFGASTCPGGGTGVVVDVVVNDRSEHAQVWVEKSDDTLSYPPCELVFR
jgi:hypothetical protein